MATNENPKGTMAEPVDTEAVVQLSADATPFKNTTTGKTIRTFFQSIAGVLLVFALSEEFRNFVTDRYPELAIFLPLTAALFTAVQNALDPHVKNI